MKTSIMTVKGTDVGITKKLLGETNNGYRITSIKTRRCGRWIN